MERHFSNLAAGGHEYCRQVHECCIYDISFTHLIRNTLIRVVLFINFGIVICKNLYNYHYGAVFFPNDPVGASLMSSLDINADTSC